MIIYQGRNNLCVSFEMLPQSWQHDLCVSYEMCPQSWQHNLCVKWTSYLCVCTFENAGQNIVYLTDIICKYIEISVDDNFIPVFEMKTWINWSKSNFWIYLIYIIYLNKNWKIYWCEQSFTGLGPEDRCSSWGLIKYRRFVLYLFIHCHDI